MNKISQPRRPLSKQTPRSHRPSRLSAASLRGVRPDKSSAAGTVEVYPVRRPGQLRINFPRGAWLSFSRICRLTGQTSRNAGSSCGLTGGDELVRQSPGWISVWQRLACNNRVAIDGVSGKLRVLPRCSLWEESAGRINEIGASVMLDFLLI